MFKFIQCLIEAESETRDTEFQITVCMKDGSYEGRGWPPPKNCKLDASQLSDPGFGQGPIDLSEIAYILVHNHPVYRQLSQGQLEAYKIEFENFANKIKNLEIAFITNKGVLCQNT